VIHVDRYIIYIHTCLCVRVCVCAYTHTYIYMYRYVYIHASVSIEAGGDAAQRAQGGCTALAATAWGAREGGNGSKRVLCIACLLELEKLKCAFAPGAGGGCLPGVVWHGRGGRAGVGCRSLLIEE